MLRWLTRIFIYINDYRPEQAKEYASKMLGSKLITKQTGAAGRDCEKVSNYRVEFLLYISAVLNF